MGKYNFDEIINRKNTWASKWDIKEGELPMWVADMDFKTAPEIIDALKSRLDIGALGYTDVPDEWYQAYINWWKTYHGIDIKADELVYSTGVIPTISSTLRKLATPGEKVLIQTPVYNIFYNSILNNGLTVVESPLLLKDGKYYMDFEDLDKKMSDPQVSMMILCNPANPVGRIWNKEELAKVGEIAKKNHVYVISDEVHCDITDPDKSYVPFALASDTCKEISINAIAPTKCFNIAGIQTSAVYVPNPYLRHKVFRQLNTDECGEPNFLAITATLAAFNQGRPWLEELKEYVRANKDYAIKYINENIKGLHALDTQATYLLWVDCREFDKYDTTVGSHIRKVSGLFVSPGEIYGDAGKGFIRINLACPRSMVEEGMDRLKKSFL
ncbi:MAG: pyridoxal phosphate-dependent aminotransferase [Pseudobutyrivibrio sp.]|nr:pyridoxal phosphate-dependent aminotransferase [Pseudobutyrivibrio sp.]